MRKRFCKSGIGIGLALLAPAAFAAHTDVIAFVVNKGPLSVFILFVIAVIVSVYSSAR